MFKNELQIDKNMLHNFIHNNVVTFWDSKSYWNVDDEIIDLYSLLDNKISQYLQIWDRSALITVI